MKNLGIVVILLVLVIAEGAFAGEKSTTEVKQCSANKTEVIVPFSSPSNAYKKVTPNPTTDTSASIPTEVHNVSVQGTPDSKKD